jgi:hypothetical protein
VLVGLLALVCHNRVQENRASWFAETAALEVAQPVCAGATLPDAPELGAGPRTLLGYEGFGSGSWYAMRDLPRSWRPAANAPPTLVACLLRSSGYGASPTITVHVARTGEVLATLPVDVYGNSDAALMAAVQPFVDGAR